VLDIELSDETGLDVELPAAETQQPEPPAELEPDAPVSGIRNLEIRKAEDRDAEFRPPRIRDVSRIESRRREQLEGGLRGGQASDQQQAGPEERAQRPTPGANSRTPSRTGP
jgi:hypothetical protein